MFYIKDEVNQSRINQVLESLTENKHTMKDYAFLVHPDSLDKILGKNIRIKILKLIISWFSENIYYYNSIHEEELRNFVMSFYFWILYNAILNKDWLVPGLYRHKIGNKDFMKFKDYRILILRKMISHEEEELSNLKEELKKVEKEGIFPPSYIH
ncbi:MAG TPA: hypothetical protein VK250_02140 [Nitrososphaeraceae archaeon]|nr:hypothetical protein [Nitrososphaeraceae archaeon]